MFAGIVLALAVPAIPSPAAAAVPIEVTVDRASQATALGNRLTVLVRITNAGAAATDPLVADLNVASVNAAVYVDLEDWSASRTHALPPLPAGASTTLAFELQAVNPGEFTVYVVVLPGGASANGPPAVSPPVHLTVANRRTLSAGGALPVAVAVPVLLGLALAVTRIRVRRRG